MIATAATTPDQLVQDHLQLVFAHANRLARRWRCDSGDLVTVGYIGLAEAARNFDDTRGAKFCAYATKRIIGAMIDQQRNEFGRRDASGEPSYRMKHHAGLRHMGDGRMPIRARDAHNEVESKDFLDWATAKLNPRSQMVVKLLAEGFNSREVASVVGFSESRVSQLLEHSIRPVLKDRIKRAHK